jgi:predicted metal-binding membrane protein
MDRTVRIALLAVVIALTAAAWFFTYFEFQNMGLLMQVGVPMSLGMEGWASAASFLAFTGMWLVMMVAMMLPSTYPTLLLHRTVYRKRAGPAFAATLLFALSYFLVWTISGVLFYSGYVLIGALRESIPGSENVILRIAGVALIVSGLYQWSWLKQACLKHCQNPLHFVMEHWHDGPLGALRMGAVHGMYCFGCCWGLMLILFVMGIMHLGWMAAIGALILLEKLVPSRRRISQAIGLVFVTVGTFVAVQPHLLSRLSSQVLLGN